MYLRNFDYLRNELSDVVNELSDVVVNELVKLAAREFSISCAGDYG